MKKFIDCVFGIRKRQRGYRGMFARTWTHRAAIIGKESVVASEVTPSEWINSFHRLVTIGISCNVWFVRFYEDGMGHILEGQNGKDEVLLFHDENQNSVRSKHLLMFTN